jgi:hypothetical protein
MPDHPERDIERLVQDYARTRRRDAGPSLELDPATRRRLQAEVARLRPAAQPVAGVDWWAWLARLWPRLTLGTALVVMLGTAWVWWGPRGGRTQEMAKLTPPGAPSPRLEPGDVSQTDRTRSSVAGPASLEPSRRATPEQTAHPQAVQQVNLLVRAARDATASRNATSEPSLALITDGFVSHFGLTRETSRPALTQIDERALAFNASANALSGGRTGTLAQALVTAEIQAKDLAGWAQAEEAQGKGTFVQVVQHGSQSAGTASAAGAPASATTDLRLVALDKFSNARLFASRAGWETGALATSAFAARLRAPRPTTSSIEPQMTSPASLQRFTHTGPQLTVVGAGERRQLLLNSFEVERIGNQLRIQDEDGSIYAGALLDEAEHSPAAYAPAAPASFGTARTDDSSHLGRPASALASAQAVTNTHGLALPFRAAGTNRSLAQHVVIEGNLYLAPRTGRPLAPLPPDAARARPGVPVVQAPGLIQTPATRSQRAAPASSSLQSSAPMSERGEAEAALVQFGDTIQRIRGQAKVGAAQELNFDARPATSQASPPPR